MNDTHLVKLKYILRKKEVMPYAIQKNTVCSVVFFIAKQNKTIFLITSDPNHNIYELQQLHVS